jgi:hypothetical protein
VISLANSLVSPETATFIHRGEAPDLMETSSFFVPIENVKGSEQNDRRIPRLATQDSNDNYSNV